MCTSVLFFYWRIHQNNKAAIRIIKSNFILPKWINSFYIFKSSETLLAEFMCFGYSVQILICLDSAWRDLIKGLVIKRFLQGRILKERLLFFIFFNFLFPFPWAFLAYFNCIFLKIERGVQSGGPLAAGGSSSNIGKMKWCVRSFNCRYALSTKILILCGTVRYASKNDKVNVYSRPNNAR